ncbi:MAG: radical SAM protein [Elusimicrobia bacterium]|nr:radical SAM protein [Elusimicrobiota bacterium]
MTPVRDLLVRKGWTLSRRPGPGPMTFVVSDKSGVFCELILEAGEAAGASASVMPAFRLRLRSLRKLDQASRAGLAELSSGLCQFLDSRRPKAGKEILARTEAHEGYQGFDLLLRTTLACNQRCAFCCVPPSRGRITRESLEAELDVLARRLGPKDALTVSGGEPLVDPRLPELLASARARGIRRFVLQTNAVGLDKPGAVERLVRLGVKHFFVSFHSHQPKVYDRITGSRGLFPKAVKALKRLLSGSGYGVTCNVVVNAWNHRALADHMRFLSRLARSCKGRAKGSLEVYFSMINGVGLAKAPETGVDLARAAPFIQEAVAVCEDEGLKVQPFAAEAALPLCLLERPSRYAAHRALGQDRVSYVEEDPSGPRLSGVIGRVKRLSCRECCFDSRCLGVPVEYARLFGLSGLEP